MFYLCDALKHGRILVDSTSNQGAQLLESPSDNDHLLKYSIPSGNVANGR